MLREEESLNLLNLPFPIFILKEIGDEGDVKTRVFPLKLNFERFVKIIWVVVFFFFLVNIGGTGISICLNLSNKLSPALFKGFINVSQLQKGSRTKACQDFSGILRQDTRDAN